MLADRPHLLVGEQLVATVRGAVVEVQRFAVVTSEPERDGVAVDLGRREPHRHRFVVTARAVGADQRFGVDVDVFDAGGCEGVKSRLDGFVAGELVRRLEPAREGHRQGDEARQHRSGAAQADLNPPAARG